VTRAPRGFVTTKSFIARAGSKKFIILTDFFDPIVMGRKAVVPYVLEASVDGSAMVTHHVHILEMNGDSYRLKQSKHRRSCTPADHQLADAPTGLPAMSGPGIMLVQSAS
jgi:hypothetical protein